MLAFAGSRGLKPGDLCSYHAARLLEEPARLRTTDLPQRLTRTAMTTAGTRGCRAPGWSTG